jgi:hypothetical protein
MDYQTALESTFFSLAARPIRSRRVAGIYGQRSSLWLARNAVGRFIVPGTTVTQDPRGNYKVVTEYLDYNFYLVEELDNEENKYPGIDRISDKLIGYVVFPSKLDPRIKTGTKGFLSFGTQREVKFTVIDTKFNYGSTGLIGGTLQQVLGDSIYLEISEG